MTNLLYKNHQAEQDEHFHLLSLNFFTKLRPNQENCRLNLLIVLNCSVRSADIYIYIYSNFDTHTRSLVRYCIVFLSY